MPSDIILIGPIGAGKSTQGQLLAERLALPQCSMDDLRWAYYDEIGYDKALAQQKRDAKGMGAVLQYWKPFEAYAVERLLAEHRGCVIDFGAGHSVYEDEALFKRVQQALAPYSNVVLLLPSPDIEESRQILRQRNHDRPSDIQLVNEHFLQHPANAQLAKHTVYTRSKAPAATCADILKVTGLT